jgi:hypothetical protein
MKECILRKFLIITLFAGQVYGELPKTYPFVPLTTAEIEKRLEYLNEGPGSVTDIFELDRRGSQQGRAKEQPWSGSYWSLRRGMVARPYERMERWTWKGHHRLFEKRARKELPKFDGMKQRDLDTLGPSEKYDLLLGDRSFDLTHKIWDYIYKWGTQKKYGFMTHIDADMNEWGTYRQSERMAAWEGICHGWAPASILFPRPRKPVTFSLTGGKKVTFYPDDIKALLSLLTANGAIQSHVLMEGYRCEEKKPSRDSFGRYFDWGDEDDGIEIDDGSDPSDSGDEVVENVAKYPPSCADVHPAIWHLALSNFMGLEGRSFVVDKDPRMKIANYPIVAYRFDYFNPMSEKFTSLKNALVKVEDYTWDPYQDYRNPETRYIVGVKSQYSYAGWKQPNHQDYDSPREDKIKETKFLYDLELDQNFKIVGGQWRTTIRGAGWRSRWVKPKQPDFFWVMPRNWKKHFEANKELAAWSDTSGRPPESWINQAKIVHDYKYFFSKEFNNAKKCDIYNYRTGERKEVDCEFTYPRPQPLQEAVLQILELSK